MSTLTPNEYVALHASRCPCCQWPEIEWVTDPEMEELGLGMEDNDAEINADVGLVQWLNDDTGVLKQRVKCLECESTWVDCYQIIGYEDLRPGKSERIGR